MKIALCISGQLRDERLCFEKLGNMAAQLGAVVFVSTWRRRGTKTSGVIYGAQFARMFGEEFSRIMPYELSATNEFTKCFPDFESAVLDSEAEVDEATIRKYFPSALIDIENESMCLDFDTPRKDNNSLRMLYKIWRCNELKRGYEKRQKTRFDLVVRLRPDIVPMLNEQIVERILSDELPKSLWTPAAEAPPEHLGDTIAITNSENADYYASLFGRAVMADTAKWGYIHSELYHHIVRAGIKIKHIAVEQWLTEDFSTRQLRNRQVLSGLIRRDKYVRAALRFPESIHVLLPIFAISADEFNAVTNFESPVWEIFQKTPSLLRMVAREAFGFLAFRYKASRLLTEYLLAETTALLGNLGLDVPTSSLDDRDRGRLHDLFQSAIEVGREDLFELDGLMALSRDARVSEMLRSMFASYVEACGAEKIRERLSMFLAASEDVGFYSIRCLFHLNKSHDLKRAEEIASLMIAKYPDKWLGWDHFGHCCSRTDRAEEALIYARKALELEPDHWGLRMRVADLKSKAGDYAAALAAYQSVLKLGNYEAAVLGCARALMLLGRVEEANTFINFEHWKVCSPHNLSVIREELARYKASG